MEYMYEDNDNELVYMSHQRMDLALTMLMKKYEVRTRNVIYHYLYRNYGNGDYEDMYQLALLKLHAALLSYREDKQTSFSHYYLEIVRHAIMDYLRGKRKMLYAEDSHVVVSLEEAAASYMDVYPCLGDRKYLGYTKEEVAKQIYHNAQRLTSLELKILRYRMLGVTYREIAEILQISMKKVDNTVRKVRYKKASVK